jgi:hypothetical protein
MIAGYVGKSQRLDDALAFQKAVRAGRLKSDAQDSSGLEFRV